MSWNSRAAKLAMADARNITTVDEAAWNEAVARATVLRRLAGQERLSRADVLEACRELGIRRARLYQLLQAYRTRPVTSSLVNRPSGARPGSRRLSAAVEALIEEAIRTFYRTRQKPSINALHKEVRRLCWQKGARAPGWHAVRARVKTIDPRDLVADREGAKAARERFRPVPGQYRADHAFEVVQIDHTMVDLIVVDSAHRMALQRPWLTLAIDVASRMVAGFCLSLEAPSAVSVALAIQLDQCPGCHRRLLVAFRLRENRAQPVCARCEGELNGRGGEGDGSMRDLTTALLAMQARIAAAVDHASTYRRSLEEVIAALWLPLDDLGAARPVLAIWISERGWRAPAEARLAIGGPMPLGLLRVPFRVLTLIAVRDLFGEEVAALQRPRERADWLFRRAAFPRPVPARFPRPPAFWPERKRGSAGGYLCLARGILAHPDWVAAAQLPERRRRRVLERLIDAALGSGLAARRQAEPVGLEAVQRSNASPVRSLCAKSDASGAHPGPFQP
jgi:hypothetical protein